MADVVMKCSGGPFDGLEFTVPDKEVISYPVAKLGTVVIYTEVLRDGATVVCEPA